MSIYEIFILSVFIFAAAVLYSSVGHGGASGYLAVMALFGLSPLMMKPTGLVLNILVSSIAAYKFLRAKYFSWPIFLPFTLSSMPFAYLGGALSISAGAYKIIAGVILLFSAVYLLLRRNQNENPIRLLPLPYAVISGAGIGFLSGLIGVGGGIFLSPLLLWMNWATIRQTSGIAAAFIFVNSVAGLLGHWSSVAYLPDYVLYLGGAAVLGGLIGSRIGSRKASLILIRGLLSVVLVIAAMKLIFI
jgi:uncharacterized membrane protein YfcA